MAESFDVNLPISHSAVFPDRCVVCDKFSPDSHVRIITGTIGWWTWIFFWFGGAFRVKAPACKSCSRRLFGARSSSVIITLCLVLAGLFLFWPSVRLMVDPRFHRWAKMGIAVISLAPQILYEVFYARAFDVTAYSKSVDYEFLSKDFAVEFAAMNTHADWVKIDGRQIYYGQTDVCEE